MHSQLATEGLPSFNAGSTERGVVLGTVGYMSPEQVRGESVDARTDIFSFGVVLYEMLTGVRAFAKDSATETLAAILRDDPPEPESNGRSIPAGLSRIIHHCLEKNPSQRFRSTHDVAFALENLSSGSGVEPVAAIAAPRIRKTPWAVALVALLAVAAGLAGWVLRGGPPPAPVFHRLTFEQGTVENARFGPDGKTVLYSARWKGGPPTLYSIPAGSLESQRLNVESSTLLAVSKDNELAVVLSPLLTYGLYPGNLARVPASGGGAREIEQSVLAADWNPLSGELAAVTVRRADWTLESPPGQGAALLVRHRLPALFGAGRIARLLREPHGPGLAAASAAGRHRRARSRGARARAREGPAVHRPGVVREGGRDLVQRVDGRPAHDASSAASLSGKVRTIWSGPGNIALQDVAADGRALVQTRQIQDGVLVLEEGAARERDLSIYDGTFSIDSHPRSPGDSRQRARRRRAALRARSSSPRWTARFPRSSRRGAPRRSPPTGSSCWSATADRRDRYTLVPTGSGPSTVVDLSGIASNQIARFFPDGRRFVFQGSAEGKPIRLFQMDPDENEATRSR